ncbi:hypothetical protein LLY42_27060 [Pseudomonas frederiksbergensis]|nr:hypothetical protein LLY42_27060 [Pseudomonas frederiksbergensis]
MKVAAVANVSHPREDRKSFCGKKCEKKGTDLFPSKISVPLPIQSCGQLDASQLAEMASQTKHHTKNVPGYSVHMIDSLAVPTTEEMMVAGHR